MKKQFQSEMNGMTLGGGSIEHPLSIHSASIGTRWKPRGMQLICTLVLLFTLGIGQMWAADPVENVGTYSTQVISADGKTSTWTFIQPSSQVTVPNAETGDVDVIYVPSGSSKMKFSSSNAFSWSGTSSGYFYVPSGAAGTISMTVKSSSDSRYLQLYVAGSAAADSKRLWSKYNATPTSDGKKGPQSFSFTSDDLTTKGTKTYLHFKDNNTEMKIASISVTLTTGSYLSSGPEDPTASFSDGDYTIGGSDLDLSSLFTTNSDGAVTYTITAQGTTDAALRADGKSFYATTSGTATVKVEQASTSSYNAYEATATITVAACETSISGQPSNASLKVGDANPTLSVTAANVAAYAWKESSDGTSYDGASTLGSDATYTPSVNDAVQTKYYYCEVTSSCSGSAVVKSNIVTVEVEAADPPCATLTPATSGDALAVGDGIDLQTGSVGGSIKVVGMKTSGSSISYSSNGLKFGGGGADSVCVTLNHMIQAGTVISLDLIAEGTGSRGLNIQKTGKANVFAATWSAAVNGEEKVISYTATAGDGLVGTNKFWLVRNNSASLKSLSVSNCGAELHALTSAVSVEGKATITLSKSLIAEGGTATATYSAIDAAYDFDEWVISGATIDDAQANPVTITMGSTDATITLKLKAAAVKHTVTYYDGETELGTELVVEGQNPTAAEIVAPHKLGYSFAGWSLTDGGAAATLSGINVTEDMPLYAVWNAVNCATKSGTIYTMSIVVAPLANCTITSTTGTHDLYQYEGVSGGEALLGNKGTSNNCILQTNKNILLKDDNSYIKLDFDCPLKEGDKIVYSVSGNNPVLSTGNSKPSTPLATLDRSKTEFVIPAESGLIDAQTIYIWKGGGNTTVTYINIVRPEEFDVTFNLHGHGTPIAPQSVLDGGTVTKPSDPSESGWDFDGWYATYVADPESYDDAWDFDNDVVTAATELHAKWTEHVLSNNVALGTLTVNGEDVAIVPSQLVYAVELPFGTTAIPTVAATAADANAKACNVTQALAVDGSATIYVKAEDNTTEATYTINFSVATSKDIQLVFKTGSTACVGSASTATQILSNNAAVSTYINQITFTNVEGAGDDGAEGSSLNVGKKAGNMFTLSAKAGYALQSMNFLAKIQDATCEYSIDGGAWTELASTNTGGDECYAPFTSGTVHEFRLRSTGTSGVWIRNMQLTIVEACTPITLAWDEEPVEFEVGKSGYAIAATANNSGAVTYSSTDGDVIAVNGSTGALTVSALGSVTLKAATAEGDGTAYCANSGNDIEISKAVNTYYLVSFDAQNGDAADEVKYYSGDAAIALPAAPTYAGYDFQGWFDAETGGNKYTAAITPAASMTVYAQWQAQCPGATITTQPTGASYLTGRTPAALVCEATAGAGGALTYEWFTCDDALKTNPVAATATPSTAVAGTFYYFCKVTEAGCDVEAFSNVVTITVADKDPICLIATTVTGATAHGDVTGFLGEDRGGDAEVNVTGGSYKMDKGKYIGVTLPEGYKFQEGDKVVLNVMTVNNATGFTLFDGKDGEKNLIIDTRDGNLVPAGANTVVLPAYAGSQSVYVLRENNNTTGNLNSAINAIAVYRTCAPILNKVTVNGAEGKPNALNQVVFEVAASTTQSQLEAIAFDWVSNDDAWTAANAPVAANAWEFGVANTVTFTDKDGDQSVYTITVNKAAASTNVELATLTVNGNAVTVVPGQAVYNYELPYGTSAAPVVAATAEDANAEVGTITQAASTTGSATFTVTAEDGTTTRDYTINFSVSLWKEVVIWDGSYMSAVTTSPDATTGMAWAATGFGSIGSYTTTYGEKSYSKYLPSGGASTGRYMTLTVPAGYVAKFYIVMASHSTGNERGMFIGSNLVKNPDATSVLELSNNDRDVAVAGMSEIVGAGTWYINPNNSIDFQEIRAYLRKGYVRDAMLGAGVYGTICVDHNVTVEDIQGATVYELVGREPQYGKLAFDEIVSGELEAGAPYVFQAHGDKLILFYGDTKVNDPVDKGNGMYGTFTDQTLTDLTDVYYFAQKALWSCVDLTSLSLPANRAYVKLSEVGNLTDPNPAPGRRRVTMGVNGKNTATGIDEITNDQSQMTNKVIIDGQLFILRGEKMYDVTGKLVK